MSKGKAAVGLWLKKLLTDCNARQIRTCFGENFFAGRFTEVRTAAAVLLAEDHFPRTFLPALPSYELARPRLLRPRLKL